MTDQSTESVYRVGPSVGFTNPTDVRTYETNADLYSPTRDITSFVTRTRAYGIEVWS
jgi:hypothetical protein